MVSDDLTLTLAIVRNRLANGKADQRDAEILSAAALSAEKVVPPTPYTRVLIWACRTALADIATGDLQAAAQLVHLVHNIPSQWQRPEVWDEELFLNGTVPAFIELSTPARILEVFAAFADQQA